MDSSQSGKKEFLTTSDVAELLSFSISRVRFEMSQGRLPYLKIGRSVRFDRKEVEKWIKTFGVANG